MVTFVLHIKTPDKAKEVGYDAAEFQEMMRREIIPQLKLLQSLSAIALGLDAGTRFKI